MNADMCLDLSAIYPLVVSFASVEDTEPTVSSKCVNQILYSEQWVMVRKVINTELQIAIFFVNTDYWSGVW